MLFRTVFGHVRFKRDPRTFEKHHLIGRVMARGVTVIRVVEASEVFGNADRVDAGGDVLEDAGMPHALLAFAVCAVVVQVGQLANERALADTGTTHDGYAHVPILVLSAPARPVDSGTAFIPSVLVQGGCRQGREQLDEEWNPLAHVGFAAFARRDRAPIAKAASPRMRARAATVPKHDPVPEDYSLQPYVSGPGRRTGTHRGR